MLAAGSKGALQSGRSGRNTGACVVGGRRKAAGCIGARDRVGGSSRNSRGEGGAITAGRSARCRKHFLETHRPVAPGNAEFRPF
jgi:hypothetical protein